MLVQRVAWHASEAQREMIHSPSLPGFYSFYRCRTCFCPKHRQSSPNLRASIVARKIGRHPGCRKISGKDERGFPMSTETTSKAASRIPTRQELVSFYRAIGISAVASAAQAAKMSAPSRQRDHASPSFLKDIHAIG
jgi:hypothetical protein